MKSVKQNISEGENKTLVREKKYQERDLCQIQIMTLINFGSLTFVTNSKSPYQGFSESVKTIGAQMKNPSKLLFEIVWSKSLVREKTGVSEGDNLFKKKIYFTLVWTFKFQTYYSKAALVTFFITYCGCGVLLHQYFKFCSNHPFFVAFSPH